MKYKPRDSDKLSNLKHDDNGKLSFSSIELYEYEQRRAYQGITPIIEKKKIAHLLQSRLTPRERKRLYARLIRLRKEEGV